MPSSDPRVAPWLGALRKPASPQTAESCLPALGPLFYKGSRDPAGEKASFPGPICPFSPGGPSGLVGREMLIWAIGADCPQVFLFVSISPAGGNPPKPRGGLRSEAAFSGPSQRFLIFWGLCRDSFQSVVTPAPPRSPLLRTLELGSGEAQISQSEPENKRVGVNLCQASS